MSEPTGRCDSSRAVLVGRKGECEGEKFKKRKIYEKC